MELIRTQFGTFFYQECKNPEQKKGSIVFIHGYATTSSYHDGFIPFATNDYDYYALQLPGHGVEDYKSYSNEKITVDFYTNYCVRLIKSLQLGKFYLIGHSMGGGLGIRVANSLNKDVLAYVAVTPMNSNLPFTSILNFWAFAPKTKKQLLKLSNLIYKDFEKIVGKDNIEDYLNSGLEYQTYYHKFFVELKRSMFSLKNLKLCRENEKHLKVPTLAIAGRYDQLISYKSVIKTFKKIPNAEVVVFEDSGHIPFQEEETKYAETVLNFFEKNSLEKMRATILEETLKKESN